jgi:hypothetical protein
MIGSAAAFPRFVLHDLRLSARGLASRFGALTPGRLGALAALLFTALHAAAWPVACWLIDVEDRPNGPERITMILASGAMLIVPWIIGQSMTDLTRMLFGRSDLELILSSPVEPRSLLAARALSLAIGAVASVGLLVAPLADMATLRGHAHSISNGMRFGREGLVVDRCVFRNAKPSTISWRSTSLREGANAYSGRSSSTRSNVARGR